MNTSQLVAPLNGLIRTWISGFTATETVEPIHQHSCWLHTSGMEKLGLNMMKINIC